jgi:hypothetical protein
MGLMSYQKNAMKHKICLLFLLSPLAGCVSSMVPPTVDQAAGMNVPAAWSGSMRSTKDALSPAETTHTDIAVWWQRFQDPLLNQLITQSLQTNTTVQSAQAALRQGALCEMSVPRPLCRNSVRPQQRNAVSRERLLRPIPSLPVSMPAGSRIFLVLTIRHCRQ